MKSLRIITLALCLQASFIPSPINATQLIQVTSPQLSLDPKGLNELRTMIAHTSVGTGLALGGCYLTTVGIKRFFTPKESKLQSSLLSIAGVATILAGLQIALGNIVFKN